MFRIKQEAARLAPELEAKGRAPIALAMGAPVAPPPHLKFRRYTHIPLQRVKIFTLKQLPKG